MNTDSSTNGSTNGVGASAAGTSEPVIDIWGYVRIIRSHLLLIALVILLVMGLTAFVTLRTPKVYRATTTVRIETQAPQVLGKDVEDVVEMGAGSFWANLEYFETQYRIIESRDVALRVVKALALHENPFFLDMPDTRPGLFEPVGEEEAAQYLQRMTSVEPVKDSRLAKIHVENTDPKLARELANAVAKEYLERNLGTMLQSTLDAADWLSNQLDEARTKLSASEANLHEFKAGKDILSISLEDRQNILAAQMTEAARGLTQAQSARIQLQAKKAAMSQAAKTKDPLKISLEVLNNNLLIQRLKQQYATLSQDYGELSIRYGKNFPKMVEIQSQLEQIRGDIGREVNNVVRAVDAELAAARATEAGLKNALEDLRERAHTLSRHEVDYNRLAREMDNNEKVYELLLSRSKEAALSQKLRANNVEILDPALVPIRPIKPRVKLTLFLSFFFGSILGIALAFLMEFADRSIKTHEDIEALSVPFLGIVPSISSAYKAEEQQTKGVGKKKPRPAIPGMSLMPRRPDESFNYDTFVHDFPKSQVAESCRSIRTNLLFMSADHSVKSLLVTSPSPQEGKTTIICNLAIAMAQSGTRVLLIDTDMRRPRLHVAFNINRPEKGLSTLILGESTFEESIYSTQIPNLDVLVCGPTPPNPSELLHTDAFLHTVTDLEQRYDRLLFDSPPVNVVTDAAILSKQVDGTMLVVRSMQTTRDACRHAISMLRDIDAPILGAVLNFLDLDNKKYSKHFFQYYQHYGYYYAEDGDAEDAHPSA